MNLNREQKEFIESKQLDPEKNLQVANTVEAICDKIGEQKLGFTSDDIQRICLISNIGQMHPNMYVNGINIYSREYGSWKEDNGIASNLNSNRGNYSIQMAEEQGIELSDEEKETIEGTSRGRASNLMSSMVKIAQTYIAVQRERLANGEQKGPAKDFNEIAGYLRETIDEISEQFEMDPQLVEDVIKATGEVYRETKNNDKNNKTDQNDPGDLSDR